MKITLTRVEGPSRECGVPRTVETFKEANRILRDWSSTAPGRNTLTGRGEGGYDKVDFEIIDTDIDLTYNGRYDLKHYHRETPDLYGHVIGALEFRAGAACPSGMDETHYQRLLTEGYGTTEERKVEILAVRDHLKTKS